MESDQKTISQRFAVGGVKVFKTQRRAVGVKSCVGLRDLAATHFSSPRVKLHIREATRARLEAIWPSIVHIVLDLIHCVSGFVIAEMIRTHIRCKQPVVDPAQTYGISQASREDPEVPSVRIHFEDTG